MSLILNDKCFGLSKLEINLFFAASMYVCILEK